MITSRKPVALVTGTSSGIGRETARLLSASGYHVFGGCRSNEIEPGFPISWVHLDVRSEDSVRKAMEIVVAETGRIDLLVNNAGYSQFGALEEISLLEAQALFDTNVFGVMRITNAALPFMRRQRSGRIINVSSLLGQVAPAYLGIYASSKFALEGLSEAWRGELKPFGIYVSLVQPSFVRTNIGRPGLGNAPEDYASRRKVSLAFVQKGIETGMAVSVVAKTILKIATSDRPRLRYPVGKQTRVILTLKRILTGAAFERMRQKVFKAEAVAN